MTYSFVNSTVCPESGEIRKKKFGAKLYALRREDVAKGPLVTSILVLFLQNKEQGNAKRWRCTQKSTGYYHRLTGLAS
jgi:hypothetical protein